MDPDLPDPTPNPTSTALVLLLIATGGILGALLRYQLGLWWPTPTGHLPWTTLTINVTGCFTIGCFMVTIGAVPRPLLRPFLVTGILGGYTTFSTYTVDLVHLGREGHWVMGIGYGLGTAAAAIAGVLLGMRLGRLLGPESRAVVRQA